MRRICGLLSLSLCLALAAPGAVRAQSSGPEYVVEEGDSLFAIGARFGVTVEALRQANGLTGDTIYVGQVLAIPGFEGIAGRLSTHEIDFGDTLDSLALRYGTSRASLLRLNRIANPQSLFVGQSVVYPQGSADGLRFEALQMHILQPGETLLGLAASRDVSPWAVLRVGGLKAWQGNMPGRALAIPNTGGPPSGLPEPIVGVAMQPFPAATGKTLTVRVRLSGPADLSGALDDFPLRFAPTEGEYVALQGVAADADPGLHGLVITATLPSGQAVRLAQRFPARAVDYGVQILPPVDPSTLDPAVTEPELAYVQSLAAQYTPERYWSGRFMLPSAGPTRSWFGVLREFNEGQLYSVHTGTDFAGAPGAPIYAAADGVVVMTDQLAVRGLATLIDHGWGVFTGYWHQSEFRVQVGDRVSAGQEIGLVGATGRVTGPHLHWEVWVGGVPVDPIEWTEVEFP